MRHTALPLLPLLAPLALLSAAVQVGMGVDRPAGQALAAAAPPGQPPG